tara:strand:- start:9796 stop:11112 length:1317 start_codon:yes stop_codon:yes gene_type:complete
MSGSQQTMSFPYLKTFMMFLLAMGLNRLVRQTDLSFLSYYDPSYLTIFAYLSRMNWFESIIIFSFVPLIIKMVLEYRYSPMMGRIFGAIILLSMMTIMLSSLVYFISIFGAGLYEDSPFYMYGALYQIGLIPIVMMISFLHMTLFSLGYGQYVLALTVYKLFLNAILDYLFIYYFDLGFHGVFIATYFVYIFTLYMFIYKLEKEGVNLKPKAEIKEYLKLIRKKISLIGYEIVRLFSSLVIIHLLFFIAYNHITKQSFLEFSAAHEFLFLTNLFSIALLRVTTMYMEQHREQLQNNLSFQQGRHLFTYVMFAGFFIGILCFAYHEVIAYRLYNIQNISHMWSNFMLCLILYYPLNFLCSLVVSMFHVYNSFKRITFLETFTKWGIQLPLASYGILTGESILLWIAMIIAELFMLVAGLFILNQIRKAPEKSENEPLAY